MKTRSECVHDNVTIVKEIITLYASNIFWPTKSHRVSQRKKQREKSKLVRSISSETKGNLSRETYNPKMHPQFLAQIQHSICFNGNFQNDH